MKRTYQIFFIIPLFLLTIVPHRLYADLNNNQVIDHEIARHIETLKKENGYSSEDFNACQITWTVRKVAKADPHSQFLPHEIIFQFENNEVIKLINKQDGELESIEGLGLNCLEFNDHVYLFFDTSGYDTRVKFNLPDLSYVIYSSDKGVSWSDLKSLHQFSKKAKFILPHNQFRKYVKIYGNRKNHALTIFNLRDETTYLFDPNFKILKSVPVYNRLSDFDYPMDFYYHKNILYLVRGSCEKVKGNIQCPARAYMETSRNFGHDWSKETLPFIKKSYFLTIDKSLYHFYFTLCAKNWFGFLPAINRSYVCGKINVAKLSILGEWETPKTILETVAELIGIYNDEKPILVWRDFRFHKRRTCGFIPLIGCVDSDPFHGPNVTYAGKLDINTWKIDESIIEYKN